MNADEILLRSLAAIVAGFLYAQVVARGVIRRFGRPRTPAYAWIVATATAWAGFLFFIGQAAATAVIGIYQWPAVFFEYAFWGVTFCLSLGATLHWLVKRSDRREPK